MLLAETAIRFLKQTAEHVLAVSLPLEAVKLLSEYLALAVDPIEGLTSGQVLDVLLERRLSPRQRLHSLVHLRKANAATRQSFFVHHPILSDLLGLVNAGTDVFQVGVCTLEVC